MTDPTEENLPLKTELIDSKTIFSGEKLTLRLDTLKMGDRPPATKEIIAHPGSTVMIPITERGTVLLVKQWRPAQGSYTLELPSGTRDDDEPQRSPPLASCVKRRVIAHRISPLLGASSQYRATAKNTPTDTSLPASKSTLCRKINLKTSWL